MALAYHPTEPILVTTGQTALGTEEFRGWDTKTMQERFLFFSAPARGVHCKSLVFFPDGKTLVGGTNSESIWVWEWEKILRATDEGKKE